AADSTSVLRTDFRSVGELAITRKTSAVAVCCCRASPSCLLNCVTVRTCLVARLLTERDFSPFRACFPVLPPLPTRPLMSPASFRRSQSHHIGEDRLSGRG